MGLIGFILRLFGLGPKETAPAPTEAAAAPTSRSLEASKRGRALAASRTRSDVAPPETLLPSEMREARRRVIAYVARSRVPLRQIVTLRQQWLVQLGKVYESIASSPTDKVLELAGQVGENYEPGFRDALMLAQSIEPPPECEGVHASMIGWMTSLHSACLALLDARKLKDRSMLSQLREQLGQSRKHSSALLAARTELFAAYRLNVRPNLQKRKARAEAAAESATDETEESAEEPRRPAPPPSRSRARLAAAGAVSRGTEKRSTKPSRAAPGARRTAARKRPPQRPAR